MVWGPPGSAKSDIAQQVTAATGREYVDVRALLLDPVDLRPRHTDEGHDRRREHQHPPAPLHVRSAISHRPLAFADAHRPARTHNAIALKLGCRDPDDDKLLETALMGESDCLVTGDRDLLEMPPFNDIPILTPAGFFDFRVGG